MSLVASAAVTHLQSVVSHGRCDASRWLLAMTVAAEAVAMRPVLDLEAFAPNSTIRAWLAGFGKIDPATVRPVKGLPEHLQYGSAREMLEEAQAWRESRGPDHPNGGHPIGVGMAVERMTIQHAYVGTVLLTEALRYLASRPVPNLSGAAFDLAHVERVAALPLTPSGWARQVRQAVMEACAA